MYHHKTYIAFGHVGDISIQSSVFLKVLWCLAILVAFLVGYLEMIKMKIKKPYLTSLIMLQTTLAQELFCDITISLITDTYLPYSIFLAQPLYMRAASTIFYTFGMVREVEGRTLNDHGNYIGDHGISWKNHGILFLNFCGNPV